MAEAWTSNDRSSESIRAHTALKRWGQSADLAGAFQFLASDAAAFITGVVLNVDGGYLLT
jgi:NAD(P)-dependent dehydrogenase (short-subunit alcohol dehydrogenase family)